MGTGRWRCRHWLPRFRGTLLAVGAIHVLVGVGILAQGVAAALGPYGVPEDVLRSPHYADAIHWVYVHSVVLGVLVMIVGAFAQGPRLKRWFARALVLAHFVYLALDVRSSEPLGNALYSGTASIGPAIIGLALTLPLLHLAVCREACEG